MSVDALLNTAGRLVSLVKGTGGQQGAVAKVNGENQEQSEPANLFGALLEKPQNKLSPDGEPKDEDTQSDDSDQTEREAPAQSPVYGASQNLLVLAAGLTASTGDGQAAAANHTVKPDTNVSALADVTEADPEMTGANLSDMPMPEALSKKDQPKKDQKDSVEASKKNPASVDPKNAAKADNVVSHNQPAATAAKQADGPEEASSTLPKPEHSAQSSNAAEPDRSSVQPQQQAGKSPSVVDVKSPVPTASTAATRIADIQLVSERSFGAVKTLQIRLDPVELGAVTARIRLVADNNVEVHLVAEKAHGAEALAADRSMIEKALKAAGIADDAKISVTVTERGAVNAVQHSSASQSAGQQQASSQQQGQQTLDMQNGSDGRGNAQAHFMGGEGRRNGETGQAERNQMGARVSAEASEQEVSVGFGGRNRGLVV
ncbi:flagellar hook-length control protein FliK [Brucella grignonensis]|uniref:Flagellar hook-length control FliK family protein n=1 Tax=Brucella grignonensis TaxID=94627 RepID=A0A256F9U4_9HYPH|nr:flagellar hook-length control protein FliK [Brucella grignonensis]OYR11604.1 flagellar hook-length control FliK family protein [Brucella grignonensis]